MEKTTLKSTDVIVHKCGIILLPPAVLCIYENKIDKKLRKLRMPIRNVLVNSDIEFFAEDLKMRHKPLLDSVKIETIKKMIFLIVQHKEGVTINDALIKFNELEKDKEINIKQSKLKEIFKNLDTDLDDDLAADTDFDDLDAPIDKLGIYSDDDGDQFWQ